LDPVPLSFEPLYYGDRLTVVNPTGDVGLITLWSPQRTVERKLDAVAPAVLDPVRGRVAVVANLYGDGLFAMLCNLLHNPQIRHLVAIGQDLGLQSSDEIAAFLGEGLEPATMFGQSLLRIRGTGRLLPDVEGFDSERLRSGLTFHHLGKVSAPGVGLKVAALMRDLPAEGPHGDGTRLRVELPSDESDDRTYQPSDPFAHQVTRATPLACWQELVVRTVRFGQPTELRKGRRFELLNAKVVIAEPGDDRPEDLAAVGFERERFADYERAILDPALPEQISYTYGNRLRAHFTAAADDSSANPAGDGGSLMDTLQVAIDRLTADPESRGAYISLWDTAADLEVGRTGSAPCLTTLFFRKHGDRLTLTATYRSHNLLTAWLQNVYGLMALQRYVAGGAGMEPGPITVVSHSLTIDPSSTSRHAIARALEADWKLDDDHDPATGKFTLREDPNGYFVVSADDEAEELIAEHRAGGLLLRRYRGTSANAMGKEIAADMGVSLVSHALWLGGELQRHEDLMRGRLAARARLDPA
jgi:thymidylate synthase